MRTYERIGWLLADANEAARRVHEHGPRSDYEAKLVVALLETLREVPGVRVGADLEEVREALARPEPEGVRIIVSTFEPSGPASAT